ncbi:unnamed protein product [Musa acuminata var. zebrina]
MALFTPSGLVMQKDLLTSNDRSTRCHQASIFSHSTSSVENLLFLGAHPKHVNFLQPRGETPEDITTVEGYTDIIVLKHFKSGVARWQLLQPIFVFIKAGMIKDSIQHSTLLHQKTFLKVAVNSLSSGFLEVASRSDVALSSLRSERKIW